tara:strand:+ start:956 stop:1786 length:831 start_codon:yes stop_codon:yes gene_type:complete
MFGGSMLHKAIEVYIKTYDMEPETFRRHATETRFWKRMFELVFEDHPQEGYSDDIDFDKFALQLASPKVLDGVLVGDIIIFAMSMLKASGYEVLSSELKLEIEEEGKIPYVGTVDLLLARDKILTVADTKTSGLWQRFFKESSLVKQSFSVEQVQHTLQLKHYHWMLEALGYKGIEQYMIFTPTNLTKYTKGSKSGQFRGAPFHFAPAPEGAVSRYHEDMLAWLDMAEAGIFPRLYPSMFGKPMCPTCPYGAHCLTDTASEFVPDYIQEAADVNSK